MVSTLVPCVAPKPVPLIVIALPAWAVVSEIDVISGPQRTGV
jgi:hypothetical protein